jgi:hypothetical protein
MAYEISDYKGRDKNIKSFKNEVDRIVVVKGPYGKKIMFADAIESDDVISNRYRQKFGGRSKC